MAMRIDEGSFETVRPCKQERMEAVWRDRATRLSRPLDAAAEENAFPVLVLGVGKERYGIDLQDVAEVLPPVRATPVPGTAAVIAGVINIHDEIRPVIDLKRLLGIETARDDSPTRVILLRSRGREMGLQIDNVERIRWIGSKDLQSTGGGDAGSPQFATSQYVKGSTTDLLMLLSTEELFLELNT